MKEIELTKGLKTMVDDWRFEELNCFNWYASGRAGKERPARRLAEHYHRPLIYIYHAVIRIMPWQLPPGKIPDHKDRNPLNNQEYNIELKTYSENLLNTARSDNRKGICFCNTWLRYKAWVDIQTPTGKKRINVGTYKTREEAIFWRNRVLQEQGLTK